MTHDLARSPLAGLILGILCLLGAALFFAGGTSVDGADSPAYVVQPAVGQDRRGSITCLGLDSELSRFAIGTSQGEILVCDAKTKKVLSKLNNHTNRVMAIAFSGNGELLVSVDMSNQIIVWDVLKAKPREQYSSDAIRKKIYDRITAIEFVGSGEYFVVGTNNGFVKLLKVTMGNLRCSTLFEKPGERIWSLACSAPGKVVAALTEKNTIHVWRLATKEKLVDIEAGEITLGLAISPNGETLAFGADKKVRVWDLAKKKETQAFDVADHVGSVLTFKKDGQLFAAGLEGGKFTVLYPPEKK